MKRSQKWTNYTFTQPHIPGSVVGEWTLTMLSTSRSRVVGWISYQSVSQEHHTNLLSYCVPHTAENVDSMHVYSLEPSCDLSIYQECLFSFLLLLLLLLLCAYITCAYSRHKKILASPMFGCLFIVDLPFLNAKVSSFF